MEALHLAARILVHPAIDAEYRQKKPRCKHCGSDVYTRFRYFNNKNAVLKKRGSIVEEGMHKKLQARFACRSPDCLARNPGKTEVEFTEDGKTRKPYAKRPRPAAKPKSSTRSNKRIKPSQQQQQQFSESQFTTPQPSAPSTLPPLVYVHEAQFHEWPSAPSTLPPLVYIHEAQFHDLAPSSSSFSDFVAATTAGGCGVDDMFPFSELLDTSHQVPVVLDDGSCDDVFSFSKLLDTSHQVPVVLDDGRQLHTLDALLMKDDEQQASTNLLLLQQMEEDLRSLLKS